MAYEIEFGQPLGQDFVQGFVIASKVSGEYLRGDGIDHQFSVYSSDGCSPWWNGPCVVYASNANGLVTSPGTGLLDVTIPASRFETCYWGWDRNRQSLRFRLLATPAGGTGIVLAYGTISFEDY